MRRRWKRNKHSRIFKENTSKALEDSSLREESSIDSRGQDMQRGGRSCAERRKKQ